MSSTLSLFKRLLIGRPLSSDSEQQTRLPKTLALPVFAADALASTAFASQEILAVLWPAAGALSLGYLVPLSLVVVGLLVIVVASYFQTLHAYPNGGGSYIVSRENLGANVGLVARRVADGRLRAHRVGLDRRRCRRDHLRGRAAPRPRVDRGRGADRVARAREPPWGTESGALFAAPTYAYIVLMSVHRRSGGSSGA